MPKRNKGLKVNKKIRLEDVNEENWRIPLSVSEAQRAYVADRVNMLARAYAYRDARSRAYIIFHEDIPVGMGLYYDCPALDAYIFSEFFIDERYQGRGLGEEAARLVLTRMREDGKYRKVVLCCIDGNDAARRLYQKLGFVETGRDEDEVIMELRNL